MQAVTVPRVPAFLAVYASEIDGLLHETGPDSPDLAPLLVAYDLHLGRLVQAVTDAGLRERTAFILTADHGLSRWNPSVMPALVEAIAATGFRPEVVTIGRSPAPETDIVLTSNGVRMSNVYLRRGAAGDDGRAAVRRAAKRVGHIPRVFDKRDLRRLRASDKLGDMALEAAPPYHFSLLDDGKDRGSHGSSFERRVPVVLAGAGVRRRRKALDEASLVDVAPTIAALLGVEPPAQTQGRVMREALDPAALRGRR
ncbi:MAG: alkaline phosphatase family protein [Solirubrobacteraceae bacterium]